MLSVAAASGMRDERWTNRDKLNQVQGLLTLKKRDIKQAAVDVDNLNKVQSDEIKELKREISKMRLSLEAAKQGDAQRIRNTLRANRAAQLALRDKPISAAIEYLEQSNFVRCKDLNTLRCQKIKLMRTLLNLKLDQTRLEGKLEERLSQKPDVKQEQTLTNLISRTSVKQDAAASVYFTYTNILAVLRRDKTYFSTVLDLLNRELMEQCKAVLKVTGKGQDVTEEVADIRDECRRYEEKLKQMMHDRSEAVNQMKLKVEHNRSLCKALVRVESATTVPTLRKLHGDVNSTDDNVKELQKMESIMQKLRNVTLVQETNEIYPRLKDQVRQHERLKTILASKTKKRDNWLKKRNHAEISRDNIMHNMQEFTMEYKSQKAALLKEIGDKRAEQKSIETEMEKVGRFMVSARAALFSTSAILDHVRTPNDRTEDSAPPQYQWDPSDAWRSFEPEQNAPKENAKKLLQKIYFKTWLLMEQLSASKEIPVLRHSYSLKPEVMVEGRGRGDGVDGVDGVDDQLDSSILDADDDKDPTVPTRAELKAQSKKIVDYYLKLPEMKPDRKPRKPRPDETKYWCPRPVDPN